MSRIIQCIGLSNIREIVSKKLVSLVFTWYSINARMDSHDGGVHDDLESDLKRKLKLEAERAVGGGCSSIGQVIFPTRHGICVHTRACRNRVIFLCSVTKVPSNSSRSKIFPIFNNVIGPFLIFATEKINYCTFFKICPPPAHLALCGG